MAREKKLPIFENVEITDIAAEGNAIAKVNDYVIFIPQVIPGDVIDIRIVRKKKNFMEGVPVKFHKYSPMRVEAFCEHFGLCGGCKWQNLPYEKQLEYKHQQVIDNIQRIGKIIPEETRKIIPSKNETYYRNKLEFTFSDFRWLTDKDDFNLPQRELNGCGFHIPKKFDRVLEVNKCWLQPDPSNDIRNEIKNFANDNEYSFYNLKKNSGLMRSLMVRNTLQGDLMVIVTFGQNDTEKINRMMQYIIEKFPQITSLYSAINDKPHDSIYSAVLTLVKGEECIYESLGDLKFKISPQSFFQTNSAQAVKLYNVVKEFAALTGNEIVYDLYTGTGTIANFVARDVKIVVGIESVPEAIEDAKINAKLNNISNTHFIVGDMKDVFSSRIVDEYGRPDLIILDPPRAGMHPNVIKNILEAQPEKIVYVSCNPATQARDLSELSIKYKLNIIQPVDMFPHTHHVENVALLSLIK